MVRCMVPIRDETWLSFLISEDHSASALLRHCLFIFLFAPKLNVAQADILGFNQIAFACDSREASASRSISRDQFPVRHRTLHKARSLLYARPQYHPAYNNYQSP